MSRMVVFCRLEGSPFDPYTRPPGASADGLRALDQENVVVVFFSSRTRAELELVQEQLGVRHPFVSENGGAVFMHRNHWSTVQLKGTSDIAGFQAVVYGLAYFDVVAALRRVAMRTGVPIMGFNDMSVADVAAELGVSSLQARLAKLRDYEEPFRVVDEDADALNRLQRALGSEGFQCRAAGRFTHVGHNPDAGIIVSELMSLYRLTGPVVSIGIGDPRRDRSLLRRTDVVLASPEDGTLISEAATDRGPALAPADGPAVWARAILDAARRHQYS